VEQLDSGLPNYYPAGVEYWQRVLPKLSWLRAIQEGAWQGTR